MGLSVHHRMQQSSTPKGETRVRQQQRKSIAGQAHLEASAHMDNDHDGRHTDNPDGVTQGVQNLVSSVAAKCVVASESNPKVAVGHQGISQVHTKLQSATQM